MTGERKTERGKGERDEERKDISISSQREMLTQSKSMIPSTSQPSAYASSSFGHSLAESLKQSPLAPSYRLPTSPLPSVPLQNIVTSEMGSKSIQVKLLNEETESIIKAIRSELLKFQSADDPVPPQLHSALKGQNVTRETNIVRQIHSREYPSGSRETDQSVHVTKKEKVPKGLSVYDSKKKDPAESRLHYV